MFIMIQDFYLAGPLELQFMRMLCENRPRLAAKLIANDTSIFKRLFSGNVLGENSPTNRFFGLYFERTVHMKYGYRNHYFFSD